MALLKRDYFQGPGVIGRGGVASECQRTGLDGILENDPSL